MLKIKKSREKQKHSNLCHSFHLEKQNMVFLEYFLCSSEWNKIGLKKRFSHD